MYPLTRKLLLELESGVWFFGDDDDFLVGKREQEPIVTFETHLIRRFSPGFWISLHWIYFRDGRQTIGGEQLSDAQSNSSLGGTLVKPLSRRQVIKPGYATGVRARFGTDFDGFPLSSQALLNSACSGPTKPGCYCTTSGSTCPLAPEGRLVPTNPDKVEATSTVAISRETRCGSKPAPANITGT
jgi:hypothetical protein